MVKPMRPWWAWLIAGKSRDHGIQKGSCAAVDGCRMRRRGPWRRRWLSACVALLLLLSPGSGVGPVLGDAAAVIFEVFRLAGVEHLWSGAGSVLGGGLGDLLAPSRAAHAQAQNASRVYIGTVSSGLIVRGSTGTWSQLNSGHDLASVNVVLSPAGLPSTVYIYGTTSS